MPSQDNLDKSITTHAPTIIQIEGSKLVPWLMLCSILSGAALVASVMTNLTLRDQMKQLQDKYYDVEYTAETMKNALNDYRNELAKAGIKPPPLPEFKK